MLFSIEDSNGKTKCATSNCMSVATKVLDIIEGDELHFCDKCLSRVLDDLDDLDDISRVSTGTTAL